MFLLEGLMLLLLRINTQGFTHAKHTLYLWATSSALGNVLTWSRTQAMQQSCPNPARQTLLRTVSILRTNHLLELGTAPHIAAAPSPWGKDSGMWDWSVLPCFGPTCSWDVMVPIAAWSFLPCLREASSCFGNCPQHPALTGDLSTECLLLHSWNAVKAFIKYIAYSQSLVLAGESSDTKPKPDPTKSHVTKLVLLNNCVFYSHSLVFPNISIHTPYTVLPYTFIRYDYFWSW